MPQNDPVQLTLAQQTRLHDITTRVQEVVAEQLGVSVADVSPEKKFIGDLGADSLDTVELIMSLEDEFRVEIPDEEAEKISTVQQAIDYLVALNRAF